LMLVGRAAEAGVKQSLEDEEWIAIGDVQTRAEEMNLAVFGEDAVARVLNLAGQLLQVLRAEFVNLGIAERDQSRLQLFGRRAAADFQVAAQAGCKAAADRLDHRVNPQSHALGCQ